MKDDFSIYSDSRILYKTGMEKQAEEIANILDLSIKQVETNHGKSFTKRVLVHICDTTKCFSKYTHSNERIKAAVSENGLFLSPLAFNKNRQSLFLTHELSHLHLFQQISLYRAIFIPQWFHEGLAVYASNGGGADFVSKKEAVSYLFEGKYIIPVDDVGLFGEGGVWGERWPINYSPSKDGRLQQHMNYRQSVLFYEFLTRSNKATDLLRLLEKGRDFSSSFKDVYGKGVKDMWDEFLREITLTIQSTRTSLRFTGV